MYREQELKQHRQAMEASNLLAGQRGSLPDLK